MGITDLRVVGCNLEAFENGVWTVKADLSLCTAGTLTSLQNQITDNDTDILALQNADTNLQSQITANLALINQNALDIGDNLLSVQQHQVTLDDHETRITALEAAGGGGSGGVAENILTKKFLANASFVSAGNQIDFVVNPADEYARYELQMWLLNDTSTSVNVGRLNFNDDLVSANYRSQTDHAAIAVNAIAVHSNDSIVQNPDDWTVATMTILNPNGLEWTKTDTVLVRGGGNNSRIHFGHTWRDASQVTKISLVFPQNLAVGTFFALYGIKLQSVLVQPVVVQSQDTVTFDAGGYAYANLQDSETPDKVAITANGNGGNCIQIENINIGGFMSFDTDITGKTISDIVFDIFRAGNNVSVKLIVDGIEQVTLSSALFIADQWSTVRYSDDFGTNPFPLVTGSTLTVMLVATGNGVTDARLDNIKLEF